MTSLYIRTVARALPTHLLKFSSFCCGGSLHPWGTARVRGCALLAAVDQERPSSLPWSLLVAVLILIFFLLFRLLTSGALLASATEAQLQASAAVVLEV